MQCHGKVKSPAYLGFDICRNGAFIKRGDSYYCWQHDPEGQAKRDVAAQKTSAKQKKVWEEKRVR